VYSLAETPPIKSGGFSVQDESFADAARYADWKFFYTPADAPKDPGAPGPQANQGASRP
jgi:hypothetical protein